MRDEGTESVGIVVDAPEHAPEVCDFLRRCDYGAEQVDDLHVEAQLPEEWPNSLGRSALLHFIRAWNRAHPEQYVAVVDDEACGPNGDDRPSA